MYICTYHIYVYTLVYTYYAYRFRNITISNFNLMFLKSSNMGTNTFHASIPTILPYNVKKYCFTLFCGVGDVALFIPYIKFPIGPKRGLPIWALPIICEDSEDYHCEVSSPQAQENLHPLRGFFPPHNAPYSNS